jgi:hypothetical protein
MPAPQLIVLERDGHWAAALRQELDRDPRNSLPLPLDFGELSRTGEGRRKGAAASIATSPHPNPLPKGEGTVKWRRQSSGGVIGARVIEIRSWEECWERLARCPTALIAAELTDAGAEQMLAALSRLDRGFPQAALVALADRRLAGYRDLIREAGAVHFIISPRRLNEVCEILRRRTKCFPGAEAIDSPTERIRENLPWSDAIE